jgi:nitroreductase
MANSRRAMSLSTEKLLTALRWRYATKRFDPARHIAAATWDALEESLVLTPSSFGLQPWKFMVIKDPGVRANLAAESWNQPQVTEASHLVVLTARTDLDAKDVDSWLTRMAEIQSTQPETVAMLKGMIGGFAQGMTHEARHAWNIRQTYIALGQLMTSAAVLGIDTCPLEGISTAGYDHLLNLEGTGYATAVACALGYRLPDDRAATTPKARFDRTRVISHV